MKILIINHYCCLNKGDSSILNSMLMTLSRIFPRAKFTVLSHFPEIDSARCNVEFVQCIPAYSPKIADKLNTICLMFRCIVWAILSRHFKLNGFAIVNTKGRKALRAYEEAYVVIARGNDCLTDAYGRTTFLGAIYEIFLAVVLKKRMMIFAQTIGPLKNDLEGVVFRFLMRLVLNRVNLITVREEFSRNFLQGIGVNKPPIYVTADAAFLLPPASEKRAREILSKEGIQKERESLLIGITISTTIHRYGFLKLKDTKKKYNEYIKMIAHFSDYLIENLNATVVFVPHVFGKGVLPESDDRIVAEDVSQLVKHKKRVKMTTREYSPEEIRAIIGKFELFVSTRLHATIHALSMCVPTIGIDYTYKVKGIMKMHGQERWVCDMAKLDFNELVSKVNDLWAVRDRVRNELVHKRQPIYERALLNARLAKNFYSVHEGYGACTHLNIGKS